MYSDENKNLTKQVGETLVERRAQYADEFVLDLHDAGYWMARWHKTTYPIGKDKEKAQEIISRLNTANDPKLECRGNELWVCWNKHSKHEECKYELLLKCAL